MTSKVPLYIFVALLIGVGAALSIFRHESYGVPWTPGETRQIWDIEARVQFDAEGKPVKASLAVPDTQTGFTKISENSSSAGYGVAYASNEQGRRAEWSIRQATVHRPSITKRNS